MASSLTVLVADPELPRKFIPKAWTLHRKPEDVKMKELASLFVLVQSTWLEKVSGVIKEAQSVHKLGGLIVRNDVVFPDLLISEFWYAKLRSFKNALVHNDISVPRRILNAWSIGAQSELIALANVERGMLYVRNCALERFVLEKQSFSMFEGMTQKEFETLELSADGEYIHWPSHDVDLDMCGIRAINDPGEAEKQRVESMLYAEHFGAAVRSLRTKYNLAQSDFKDLSEREIRRIESGSSIPHTTSLQKLASGHGLEYKIYLDELAEALYKRRHG